MTSERLAELRRIIDWGARGSVTVLPQLRSGAVELLADFDILRAQLADAERHRDILAQRLAVLTCGEPDPLIMAAATTIARLRMENAALTTRCEQQAIDATSRAHALAGQDEEIRQLHAQIAKLQETP